MNIKIFVFMFTGMMSMFLPKVVMVIKQCRKQGGE